MSILKQRLDRLRTAAPDFIERNPHLAPPIEIFPTWGDTGVQQHSSNEGKFLLRKLIYSFDDSHGIYKFGQLSEYVSALSKFTPKCSAPVRIDGLLFFDTETTGLGVGAGNVPFMLGIGYYAEECFTLEQLFIRNPSEERAMLIYLQNLLTRFTHIVTYNGKSFDWPLLRNRFVLNRLPFKDHHLHHIDLLFSSRSLWKHSLTSCRLGIVESDKLGIHRVNDVPGAMAPEYYFKYLATGDSGLIEAVFHHNGADILSLASLAIHFSKVLCGNINFSGMKTDEVYRLALWLDKMGKNDYAEIAMEFLLSDRSSHIREYLLPIALFFKKKGKYRKAVPLWEQSIAAGQQSVFAPIEPFIELAIYYEHHHKDILRAENYAQDALNRMWKKQSMSRGDQKQRRMLEQTQRRLQRLQKKKSAKI